MFREARAAESSPLTPSARESLRQKLGRALGNILITDRDQLAAFAGDESENDPVLPDVVVMAESTAHIQRTLEIASECRAPVTPRAGGSGKSGGCIPVQGGVVLATQGLQRVIDIDAAELIAVVEPGVILGELHRSVEALGLFYPPDANSLEHCAIGGNIAENAGGPRAFKYGTTRDYVLGLEAVLMDGTRMDVGRRTKKGVTGYDLVGTLVGSEGTLAVTTRAILRLLPRPEHELTLLASFDDVFAAGAAVERVLSAKVIPRCIELLDQTTLDAVRARGVPIDAGAGAVLIMEVDGVEATTTVEAERVGAACDEARARSVVVAQDAAQRDRLWAARRALSPTTRAMARFKVSEDVVVPRRHIGALLDEVRRMRETSSIRTLAYGHAGDGNLHVNLLWDDPSQLPEVETCLGQLFQRVLALGGTLTGEHGVGLSKRRFLPLEQAAPVIALQQRIKAAFDPHGLLNPGKIFPAGRTAHGAC